MWKELIDNASAVIFDLDGTVVDSMWIWHQIDCDFFAKHGKKFPNDYQKNIEGMSVKETAVYTKDNYNFSISVDEIIQEWNDMAFDKYSNEVVLKEGIIDFLDYLKQKNIKIGIATSNNDVLCNEVLLKRGIKDYFDVIVTCDECMAGKPAPDVYLAVANKIGVDPRKCLVFEDLLQGIRAGKNAGMTTVTISDDYSKNTWEDKKTEADYYIESYREIVDEIYN